MRWEVRNGKGQWDGEMGLCRVEKSTGSEGRVDRTTGGFWF